MIGLGHDAMLLGSREVGGHGVDGITVEVVAGVVVTVGGARVAVPGEVLGVAQGETATAAGPASPIRLRLMAEAAGQPWAGLTAVRDGMRRLTGRDNCPAEP